MVCELSVFFLRLLHRCCIGLGLGILLVLSKAATAQGLGVALWADAADSSHSVSFEGKQLQLTTGALGFRVASEVPLIGELRIDAGVGYAPDRDASFIGAKLEGDAELKVLGLGFRREMALPNMAKLVLALEGHHLYQELQGDFGGQFGRQRASADMTATLKTSDFEVGLFRVMERSHLGLGVGLRYWDVSAQANGQLGESIRASTDADFTDTSVLVSATLMFPVFKRDMSVRYEWTQIPADKSVAINRLTLRWRLR